jgi:hypothetical protein
VTARAGRHARQQFVTWVRLDYVRPSTGDVASEDVAHVADAPCVPADALTWALDVGERHCQLADGETGRHAYGWRTVAATYLKSEVTYE